MRVAVEVGVLPLISLLTSTTKAAAAAYYIVLYELELELEGLTRLAS